MTRGQTAAADVSALLRARKPLIWVVTREEARAEAGLFEAAAAANYVAGVWDTVQGAATFAGNPLDPVTADCVEMLKFITARSRQPERNLWIMRDLPIWLSGIPGAVALRQLRNFARTRPTMRPESAQAIIILSSSSDIPPELSGDVAVVEWPLPDREEIAALLDAVIQGLPDELKESAAPNGQRDAAIDAAIGLSAEEAQSCFARSIVQLRRIDPAVVASEKRRIIARERVLEWFDPLPGGLDAVGGLENLKAWLVKRGAAYTVAFRAYAPTVKPKGVFLVGVQGCGKSLTAKAIAAFWGVPLLKLDLGGLKDKFVGQSEANLRRALRVIEAIGRCVVWIDEIEKALQGTSGAADGGVSSDQLGTILTWMQERVGDAFVVATANDVTSSLPPELLRKGRFDEIWFIDLPNLDERLAILIAALRAHGRDYKKFDNNAAVQPLLDITQDFTGSEIAELVPDALFAAFSDGAREITMADLMASARTVTPLAKTADKKIAALREWAQGRARPATRADTAETQSRVRQLDI